MNFIRQAAVLFSICLAGEMISKLLPFPTPGSVLSMLILFVLLAVGLIKEKDTGNICDFFLKNMAFFFIPSGVGILEYLPVIGPIILPFLAICLISTLVTFGVTALTVRAATALQNRFRKGLSK